jgi:hypothetical protein
MFDPAERPVIPTHDQNLQPHEQILQSNNEPSHSRIGRALTVAAVTASICIAGSSSEASVGTGGYPDWNATDCSAVYGIYSWCKPGDDWISPRSYGYKNCTDWVAWRIPQLVQMNVPPLLGDAKYWDNNAPPSWTIDNTAEPGDIAVWEANTPRGYGHVAVVESINPLVISEYNYDQHGNYGTRTNPSGIDHFLDLNGTGNGITGAGASPTPETPPLNPYGYKNVTVVQNILGGLSVFTASDAGLVGYKDQSYPGEDLKAKPWGSIVVSMKGQPEVVKYPDGTLSVFGHGVDGRLYHSWQTGPGTVWSEDITPWDVSLRGEPSAVFNYTGGASVFFPDSNGEMREIDQIGQDGDIGSQPVHNLHGNLQGKPAVINIGGKLALFAHGADGQLKANFQQAQGGAWSGWESLGLGHKIKGDPKVFINRLGGMSVLAIGESGEIVGIDQVYPGESMNKPFYSLSKPPGIDFSGTPAVIQTQYGEQMVFAVSTGGRLYHKAQVNSNHYNWTEFFHLGGNFIGAPTVVKNALGGVSVFGRNPDGTVITVDQPGYGAAFSETWAGLLKP